MNSTLSKLPLSETTTNVYVVYSEEVLTTGYKSSILVIASPHWLINRDNASTHCMISQIS